MPTIQSLQRESLRNTLKDRETYATVLLVIALDTFGPDCLTWTRETIQAEFLDDWNIVLPPVNLDKIMAAISILTTDLFFKNLSHFIQICNVLCGDTFDPFEFDPATVAEMAWGITEALLLFPPDEDEPFSDDIRYYIGARLQYEGMAKPPSILRIARHDKDLSDALDEYADQPEFQAQVRGGRIDRSAQIDKSVKENIQDLLDKVQSLPLTNGDAKKAVDELRRGK